jgi:hypothetical protein
MVPIRVTVAKPEPRGEGDAELWCGGERLGVSVLYEDRLHLRIDPRADGRPWLVDAAALTFALDDVARQLGVA